MGGFFPGAAATTPVEQFPADAARTFVGDGTGVLRISGCMSVDRVFLGNQEIPQYHGFKFPADASEKPQMVTQEVPLWQFAQDADGAVLYRSFYSNHGVWQSGAKVTIVGTWEAPVVAPAVIDGGEPAESGKKK